MISMLPPVSSVLSLSSSSFSANSLESPLQHRRRRELHLIDKILRAELMPQDVGGIRTLYLVFRKISGQQRLQHRQTERLLERADHQKIRDVNPVILLFARLGQHFRADIVVDCRCRNGLRLLELRRKIAQILLEQLHHLFHVQPEVRNLFPCRKPVAFEIFFPPAELARDEIIIISHKMTHTFRLHYSNFLTKLQDNPSIYIG